jgi:hypothetical protein
MYPALDDAAAFDDEAIFRGAGLNDSVVMEPPEGRVTLPAPQEQLLCNN